MANKIILKDINAAYGAVQVLHGISMDVGHGETVALLGTNGNGKSTLIKACMGLLPASAGWVKVFGKPINQSLLRVGYVPQRESVDWDFPVNVMDVVLMGRYGKLGLFRRPTAADRSCARDCLERVKMLPFADRQISNLSGGQQQRVFLARALAQESDLYFMDEPFAGVDAATETEAYSNKIDADMMEEGRAIAKKLGVQTYKPTPEEMKIWQSTGRAIWKEFDSKFDKTLLKLVLDAQAK